MHSYRAVKKNYWIFISGRAMGRVLRDIIWRATGKVQTSNIVRCVFILIVSTARQSFLSWGKVTRKFSVARITRQTIGKNLLTIGHFSFFWQQSCVYLKPVCTTLKSQTDAIEFPCKSRGAAWRTRSHIFYLCSSAFDFETWVNF